MFVRVLHAEKNMSLNARGNNDVRQTGNPVSRMNGLVGQMDGFEPELEVVRARRLAVNKILPVRYKIILSDGFDTILGLCGPRLSMDFGDGVVREGSILRLKSFRVAVLLDGVTKVCVVGDFSVVIE